MLPAEYASHDLSFVINSVRPVVLRSPIDTPIRTSFGIMTDRPALYLFLEDTNGNIGTGEVWCNFPGCGAEHRARLLETVIAPTLIGKEFLNPVHCHDTLQKQFQRLAIQTGEFGPIAQVISGIDIGLWDLVSKRVNLPLYQLLGGKHSSISAYASGINPTGALEMVQRCRDSGYTAFKLKIGFGDYIDYPNIENICANLLSGEVFMVDANQAWNLDEATRQIAKLSDYPIEWLEEPIMADSPEVHWNNLATVSNIPLAAGENMLTKETFSRASKSSWLDVMQPDVCKWGGISGVLPVAREALKNGRRYCPHYLGGGVGLLASAHLLAAAGGTGLLEVDSNPNPLRENVYAPSIKNGQTVISDEPGLGLDMDALSVLQKNPEFKGTH